MTHLDVLIVGAGISGIGAAYYLQTRCRRKSYLILEGRKALGGTWDLFRYPGIRSDSDMHTLGYSFRPWTHKNAIAGGDTILNYLRDTAREYGIDRQIRFEHRVRRAEWSSVDARWRVEAEVGEDKQIVQYTCNFLYMGTGYYDYDRGHSPTWQGMERYKGCIIHPQHWPENLDYTGKRVVVIGSGATAVTLVPAMTDRAAHVTMLQRSPTYIVSRPAKDTVVNTLHRFLPARLAHRFARWKSILLQMAFFTLAQRRPESTKETIIKMAREELGADYDVQTHFTPTYNPWDQRLCLVPDSDLFKSIREGKASVVTGHIDTFTETGIRLTSGEELPADIIITATGLTLRLMNGIQLIVDGEPVELGKTVGYKSLMYRDIPNLAAVFGYTNASWTLKAELIAEYFCRLINYMDAHGYKQATPRLRDESVTIEPVKLLSAGYIQRAADNLPRQGSKEPWRVHQNYLIDIKNLRFGKINDGAMEFK